MRSLRFVPLMLVAALILTPGVAPAATSTYVYTALGDSLAVGTGGTDSVGYVDLLYDHLSRSRGEVMLHEGSHDGMTSGLLLDYLTNPASPYYPPLNTWVADADLMTVSIGGNDLLQPMMGFIAENPQYLDPAYIASLTPEQWLALAGDVDDLLRPHVIAFSSNWPATACHLRALNPGAEIQVATLYNPFTPGDGVYEMFDPYVRAMNDVIAGASVNPACGYRVVDVYSSFAEYGNPRKPIVHDLTHPVALHPTDRGYKLIFNLHKDSWVEP